MEIFRFIKALKSGCSCSGSNRKSVFANDKHSSGQVKRRSRKENFRMDQILLEIFDNIFARK